MTSATFVESINILKWSSNLVDDGQGITKTDVSPPSNPKTKNLKEHNLIIMKRIMIIIFVCTHEVWSPWTSPDSF